ncbi:MAG: UrcA family protein [Steroidobacterales bacterium]
MNAARPIDRVTHLEGAIRTATLLLFCFAAPAAVLADPPEASPVMHSAAGLHQDFDLSTPEGVRAARERLRDSARRLCLQVAVGLDVPQQQNLDACIDDTVAEALRKIDGSAAAGAPPTVVRLHDTASGSGRPGNADPDSRSARVSLADLDLTTEAGVRAAQERLHQAARRLCSQLADSEDLGHQPHFVKCVDQTLAAALRQVALPALVAKDAPKTEQPPHP